MMTTIKSCISSIRDVLFFRKICSDERFEKQRLLSEIIRTTHSIEKGLSIDNPRKGFGYEKITSLFNKIDYLFKLQPACDCAELQMAKDALFEYCEHHKQIQYNDAAITEIAEKTQKLADRLNNSQEKIGGTQTYCVQANQIEVEEVKKLFFTRHSIRDFSEKDISWDQIEQAVTLAQSSPSACNRQSTRVYVAHGKSDKIVRQWISGVGGFGEEANKILLITGKLSAYRFNEKMQYAVSASIFAGYLAMAFHAAGIEGCLVQRPLTYNKQTRAISKEIGISEDERIVLAMCIGYPKEKVKVPVSHRFSADQIVQRLE